MDALLYVLQKTVGVKAVDDAVGITVYDAGAACSKCGSVAAVLRKTVAAVGLGPEDRSLLDALKRGVSFTSACQATGSSDRQCGQVSLLPLRPSVSHSAVQLL